MKLLISMAEFDEVVEAGLEIAKSKAAANGLEFTEHEEVTVKIGLSCGIKALSDHISKKDPTTSVSDVMNADPFRQ